MTERRELIPHADNLPHPLGRHINHDEASKAFPAQLANDVMHVRHTRTNAILDQGSLGSCTGNAMVGCLGTQPYRLHPGVSLDEALAVAIYEQATALDPYPGQYPPDDTGSDGLSVAKAAQARGLIRAYDHAFGLEQTILAASLRPVIIGIPWYDSMFDPDIHGFVVRSAGARLAGGHEVVVTAVRTDLQAIVFDNSWSAAWGRNGRAYMSFDLLGDLLDEGGDCTVPRY